MSEEETDLIAGCWPIVLLVLLSIMILGFQCFVWLRTGEWYELPLWKSLEAFGVDWRPFVEIEGWAGISKILLKLAQTPTALCPLIAIWPVLLCVQAVLWFLRAGDRLLERFGI